MQNPKQLRNKRSGLYDSIRNYVEQEEAAYDAEMDEWYTTIAPLSVATGLHVPPPDWIEGVYDEAEELMAEVSTRRYLRERAPRFKRKDNIMDVLDAYEAKHDTVSYRNVVRMQPEAFRTIVRMVEGHKVFDLKRAGDGRRGRPGAPVAAQVAIALNRLGTSGNASGFNQMGSQWGFGQGSCKKFTDRFCTAMASHSRRILTWASPAEVDEAKEWVKQRIDPVRMPGWVGGWAVMDGTKFDIAEEPSLQGGWFGQKGLGYNCLIISLPHTLRIISATVGPRASEADITMFSKCPVSQSPALYFKPGEFLWVDGGFRLEPYMVAPYPRFEEAKQDSRSKFNYGLLRLRVRSEHSNRALKGRFQCLHGLRYRISTVEEDTRAQTAIIASICAHNVALAWDRTDDLAFFVQTGGDPGNGWTASSVVGALRDYQEPEESRVRRRRIYEQRAVRQDALDAAHAARQSTMTNWAIARNRRAAGKALRHRLKLELSDARAHGFSFQRDSTRLVAADTRLGRARRRRQNEGLLSNQDDCGQS